MTSARLCNVDLHRGGSSVSSHMHVCSMLASNIWFRFLNWEERVPTREGSFAACRSKNTW